MASRRGRPRKNGNGVGQLYPPEVPIDEATGFPPEEADIPEDVAKRIPMDDESARVAQHHQEVMRRKASGESFVKWSADARIRYSEAVRIQPLARVIIRMVEPHEDDNVPTRPISVLRDYDALIQHIKESHWLRVAQLQPGQKATYKWVIGDENQPQWATGLVKFGPRPEEERQPAPQQQQNPYGYPQQQNPYGVLGAPMNPMGGMGGYGYGGMPYMQQPQMQQPQPQMQQYVAPAPQQQPAPEPVQQAPQAAMFPQQAANYDVVQGLLGHIERLSAALMEHRNQPPPQPPPPQIIQQPAPQHPAAQLLASIPPQVLAQMPHLLPYLVGLPPQPPAPAPNPTPVAALPVPPASPIEAARDAMVTIRTMASIGKQIAADFAPKVEPEEPEVSPNPNAEPSPYIVQDIGLARIIKDRETGERVEGFEKFLMNSDKWGGVVKGAIREFTDVLKSRVEMQNQQQQQALDKAKQLAEVTREIAEQQERISRARAFQLATERPQTAPQPAFVQSPPQQAVQSPPPMPVQVTPSFMTIPVQSIPEPAPAQSVAPEPVAPAEPEPEALLPTPTQVVDP